MTSWIAAMESNVTMAPPALDLTALRKDRRLATRSEGETTAVGGAKARRRRALRADDTNGRSAAAAARRHRVRLGKEEEMRGTGSGGGIRS